MLIVFGVLLLTEECLTRPVPADRVNVRRDACVGAALSCLCWAGENSLCNVADMCVLTI